jgi:hypothetical protein
MSKIWQCVGSRNHAAAVADDLDFGILQLGTQKQLQRPGSLQLKLKQPTRPRRPSASAHVASNALRPGRCAKGEGDSGPRSTQRGKTRRAGEACYKNPAARNSGAGPAVANDSRTLRREPDSRKLRFPAETPQKPPRRARHSSKHKYLRLPGKKKVVTSHLGGPT